MVSKIMPYLNNDKLTLLGKLYNINKPNHKITGAFISLNLVKSVLTNRAIGLRSIETLTKSLLELNSY